MCQQPKLKDFYKILELTIEATQEDIKKSFKELSKKLHPDLNKDVDADVKFKELYKAYKILSNSDKKQKYDVLYAKTFNITQTTTSSNNTSNHFFGTSDYANDPRYANMKININYNGSNNPSLGQFTVEQIVLDSLSKSFGVWQPLSKSNLHNPSGIII